MSFRVQLVRAMASTKFGRELKTFYLRLGKRRLAARWAQLAKEGVNLVTPKLVFIVGVIATKARELLPKFKARFAFLAGYDENIWAEVVARTVASGDVALSGLRGSVVERLIPDMAKMRALQNELEQLAQIRGWKRPRLLSGAVTPDQREVADWLIVAQHQDGRLWIMAIIESKSISNTRELAGRKDRLVGRHLWDVLRIKSEGIEIPSDGGKFLKFEPKQIECTPVPLGSAPPPQGLTTELIGVTPRAFTKGELRRLAEQGADVKQWFWPVDEGELATMLDDLRRELGFPVLPASQGQ